LIKAGEEEYYSCDSADKSYMLPNPAFETITIEFLNSSKPSGLPNHNLKLKMGTPIMLL
jgi:ATP-dependent DNA helicase PIF1